MRLAFCVACGEREADALEHHHLVPRAAGGSDDEANLITLCHVCHGKAHGYERAHVRRLTKIGLAAAKARGVKLGGARGAVLSVEAKAKGVEVRKEKAQSWASDLSSTLAEIQAGGATSLREIASELNTRGVKTPRGGEWSAVQVQRLLARV